jgi:hypothetical protein
MAVQIQFRGGTYSEWTSANPILAAREMVLETDTNKFKVGNGVDRYNTLPYGGIAGAPGVVAATGPLVYTSSTQTISLDLTTLIIDGGTA